MKISELKELVRQVVKEEREYQQMFETLLQKSGKNLSEMNDASKSKFNEIVAKAFKAKQEGKLRGYNEELSADQKKIDTDCDGEIEGSDLAKLRKDK